MGEVYLAEDTKLDRRVAIKFLPPESTADEQAKKRLVREAKAAAKLDHPNICSVYEVGEADGQTFIVMQYVEGENLASRIERKPFELKEALDIGAQVAESLTEAHSKGIIHRDIKPQNIMLTARGQVRVLDFGLAKVITNRAMLESEGETQSLLTESGAIVGTVPYMSPEQVKGESLDVRSDIFSFGAVLYEMISGHQPFAANTVAETISAILVSEPPPVASYSIRAPAGLERTLRKCLEKDRERRFQAAAEVAADLETVRRQCESGQVEPSISYATTVRLEAVSSRQRVDWQRLLSRRSAFALIAVVTLAAAIAYALFLRRAALAPAPAVGSVNSSAYDYYLRGKLKATSENREHNESAIKILEDVVKENPGFAPAYAELARAYGIKANYFAPEDEQEKLNEDAKVYVEKALALEPNLAEGHFVRGFLLWTHANRFPHEQAIQADKRAIVLDPNLGQAHHQLGVMYFHIGLLDKGEEHLKQALAINPSDTLARFRLGSINMCRGKYDEALALLKTVPREAHRAIVDRATADALLHLGRMEEASDIVENYLMKNSRDEGGNVTSVKAILLAKTGKERDAEEMIQRAIEIGKGFQHFHHTTYNIAAAYALMNKTDEALKWLRFTADDGNPCYPLFEQDANLNNIRKDERFIAFMLQQRQQWEKYKASL
jgi:tetratricopeptide (TPR) repeat protein/predicted Ser/Thr protein kinase